MLFLFVDAMSLTSDFLLFAHLFDIFCEKGVCGKTCVWLLHVCVAEVDRPGWTSASPRTTCAGATNQDSGVDAACARFAP